jgi:single-stranded-DNA-specific exonuclease
MTIKLVERSCPATPDLPDDLHPLLRRIYASRGVTNERGIQLRLADLETPDKMKGLQEAVMLLHTALVERWRILIIGDFDADGATSSALAVLGLRAMGCREVEYLVPNRFEYGYGLTPEIVFTALESKPDLIMTVDNGIASHAGVDLARQHGIKVLVTDHHLPADTLPAADCIINPNQPGCAFPSKAMAGVGVVFYLLLALRTRLRELGWFKQHFIAEPNLGSFLDIVALGTVADVVPLDENNRRLVRQGLRIIQAGRARPGILALLEVAGRSPAQVVAADLGFAIGPRLNAAGRLDDMSLGIACLLEEDPLRARQIATQLDALNRDRRTIEAGMQQQAMDFLQNCPVVASGERLGLCLYQPDWHQGVIGILASRLKERFHRPVIVFADGGETSDGMATIKGSARSIVGLHIRDTLDLVAKRHPALLSRFGGHAMAAGLTIKRDHFELFSEAFEAALTRMMDKESLQQSVYTDGRLEDECVNLEMAAMIREAGPWGQSFPEPAFHGWFKVISQRQVGQGHLKLVLATASGRVMVDAIAFNVEPRLLQAQLQEVELVYRLDVNEFRGIQTTQLIVEQFLQA